MTEEEAKNNPEMIVILLLSGSARELGEGKNFEKTIYKTAEQIVKLNSMHSVVGQSEQLKCSILLCDSERAEGSLYCDFCKDL